MNDTYKETVYHFEQKVSQNICTIYYEKRTFYLIIGIVKVHVWTISHTYNNLDYKGYSCP